MKSTLALILSALALFAGMAMANPSLQLQLDFSAGAGTQAGWQMLGGTGSPSGSFPGFTGLATGDITVSLTNISFDRIYKNGFTGPADNFPGTDLDMMYSDLLFRNAAGSIPVTIGGLKAGTYQITTYHMTSPVTIASEFDLKVKDADRTSLGLVGNFTMGQGNTTSFIPTIISFEVRSNGTDPIILQMDSTFIGTGGNTGGWWGINGLEIAAELLSANIDIGLDPTTNLKAGYTGLTGTNGSTAKVAGEWFTLNVSAGTQGARDRGIPSPNTIGIDALTADFGFVQADAGNVEMTLNLGGAGALRAGTWQVSVYSADRNVGLAGVQDQRIGITTTTDMTTSEVTYGEAVDQKFDGPAITFKFTSDGVSAYTLFLRDSLENPTAGIDATDSIRFNGIDLLFIPELSVFTYNPGDGSSEVSIVGAPSTRYKLVEADDLDFANPDRNPIPLTGATVGTLDGNEVIADATGNATVQFNLGTAKPATFLRAQTVP